VAGERLVTLARRARSGCAVSALVELVAAAVGGGAIKHGFDWLRSRRGSELTEQEQYRQAIADQFGLYATQLEEASKRITAEIARADSAEARERSERELRIEAERQRNELVRANEGLRARVARLEETTQELLSRLVALEVDRNEARKELARREDDDARRAARTVENTGPHPAVKLPTT